MLEALVPKTPETFGVTIGGFSFAKTFRQNRKEDEGLTTIMRTRWGPVRTLAEKRWWFLTLALLAVMLAVVSSSPVAAQEPGAIRSERAHPQTSAGSLSGTVSPETAPSSQAATQADCVEPGYICRPDGTFSLTFSSASTTCTWSGTVNWGDNASDGFVSPPGVPSTLNHTYAQPGLYTVSGSWTGTSSDPNITCTPGSAQFLVEVPVDRPDTFINTPPAPPANSTVRSNDPVFTYRSDEPSVTFECRLAPVDAAFGDCTSQPKRYNDLEDGQYTFTVRAKDADGNVDNTPATRTWTIDATPPETTITSGPPAVLTNVFKATFAFTSSEPESTFQCSLDGGPFGSCVSPKTYAGLSVGDHTFRVQARDKAGNVDPTPAVRTFKVRWVIGGFTCTRVGTEGNDVLTGTAGNDVICALGGNDVLKGLGGNDTLVGGAGIDTASYAGSPAGVTASLKTNSAAGQGSDRFIGIENLTGSDGNDVLTGSDAANTLIGLKGADRMLGLGGGDILNSRDGVNGNDRLDGGTGTDAKVTDASEASIVGFP